MPSLCGSGLYKRPQTAALAKTLISQYIGKSRKRRHTGADIPIFGSSLVVDAVAAVPMREGLRNGRHR
jgi:hypothetical protein